MCINLIHSKPTFNLLARSLNFDANRNNILGTRLLCIIRFSLIHHTFRVGFGGEIIVETLNVFYLIGNVITFHLFLFDLKSIICNNQFGLFVFIWRCLVAVSVNIRMKPFDSKTLSFA